jgi:hypothetical protein
MRGFAQFWNTFLPDKPHKKAYAAADFIATGETFVRVIRQNRLDHEALA